MIVRGEVDPLQLGAFLMLLRVKEETAHELAGFVEACRANMKPPPPGLHADLDWPSYAGKKHQHPWYILSLLLLSQAGYRIFIHGSTGHNSTRLYTETAFSRLGLPIAAHWQDVSQQLNTDGLSYLPLQQFCQRADQLLQLRPLLGLRSPVNSLVRLLNPLEAPCALHSIFHPAYGQLHQEADCILGQPRALVFKGDSGEIEIKPQANTRLLFLEGDNKTEITRSRSLKQRIPPVASPCIEPLVAMWRGDSEDVYGLEATLATAAATLALLTPGTSLETTNEQARQLWHGRDKTRLAQCP